MWRLSRKKGGLFSGGGRQVREKTGKIWTFRRLTENLGQGKSATEFHTFKKHGRGNPRIESRAC